MAVTEYAKIQMNFSCLFIGLLDFLDDIMRALFHFVENKADVIADGTGDKELDAGKSAQENHDGGVAGNGCVNNPHHNGVDDEEDTQQDKDKSGVDADFQRGFGERSDGGEGEFQQFSVRVFALAGGA